MSLTQIKSTGIAPGAVTSTNLGTLANLDVTGNTSVGNLTVAGNIMPSANNEFSLGNATVFFKDAYIGPGSLYINGTKVLEEASEEIVITADTNQTVRLKTSGSGDISLDPTGSGVIEIKGPLQFEAGQNVTTSNGSPLTFSSGIQTDSITAATANTSLTLSGDGTGYVSISDDLVITGNITIDGGAGNLSVTSLSVQDNIIDISAETTGTPTANAGIKVIRGDDPAVQLRWNEPSDIWQYTTDGTNYLNIVGTTDTGNTSLGNLATANFLSGTLTTASQPNITSIGTLSQLSVSGNVSGGNLAITGTLTVSGTGQSSIAGNLDMTSNNISNLATPVNASDAATKEYVDEAAQGLKARTAADALSSSNLSADYDNGTAGVGATLTATANGSFPTIDGVTLNTTTVRRLLVTGQTNKAENGLYVLINEGSGSTKWVLRRCSECDTSQEVPGSYVFVTGGTTYANTGWVATVANASTFVIGTDDITWIQFSGAGTYTAGTGLTLTGTTFSVNASQTQVTSVGTLTGLSVNGNITAANITANTGVFTGNAAGLTNIPSGNLTGQVANALVAGTVYTNAQPNITSVGTLSTLSVTGNANVGNIGGTGAVFTTLGGSLTTNAQPNITSVGTLTGLTIAANGDITMSGTGSQITGVALVSSTLFAGSGANLTNINASNISTGTIAAARVATLNQNTTGSAATVTTAAQPNITSVGTLTSLSVTGNANVGNIGAAAGVFTSVSGNGSALTALNGSNITTGTIAAARVATLNQNTTGSAATVTTAAQPNITSVGTLTGLTVSGNIIPNANGTINLGSSTARWNTVFTSDLDLNNGIGDWTIVEGEDELFIYNNKRGKVYKFNLTEVDPATAVPKKEH